MCIPGRLAMGQSALERARQLKSVYRTDDAINILTRAIAEKDSVMTTPDEDLLSELSDCYFISGDYASAERAYKTLGREFPEKLMYSVRQMQCTYRMKDYVSTVDIGEGIIVRDTIPAVAALIGDAFNQVGQSDSALVWYGLALCRKPTYPSVVSKAAKIYLDKKDFDQALALTDSLLSLIPDDVTVSPIKGLALYLSEKYDEAINVFERQIEVGNNIYPVHFYLGQSYWRTNVLYRAEQELMSAWQIDSSDVNLAYCIAAVKADRMLSFDKEIRPWLDRALQMLEPDPSLMSRIHQQYGHGEYRSAHWSLAISLYKKAWQYNPRYISALSIIGYCYERQGDWRNALTWYEKYLSLATPGTTSYEFVQKSVEIARAELHMEL